MTLLTVTRDVCEAVGVSQPTSVFSGISTNRTMQEMLALANEMAQRIAADTRDWTALTTLATFTGDGVTTDWPLPANYRRMLKTSNVWGSVDTQTPLRFINDADQWMQRRAGNTTDSRSEWIILGRTIKIYPAMSIGATASFAYLEKNAIALALTPGGYGDTFVNDNDVFVLGDRLLKLGMIWQWKANKGAPYAEDMGSYSDALVNAMGSDQPAPTFIGRSPISANARVAIAWPSSWGPQ